jgi:enoyl-CoA hydratase/carnithine racemase
MNSHHPPTMHEMWRISCDFRDDPEMWVAILTGVGDRAFSAGNDLKYQAEIAASGQPMDWSSDSEEETGMFHKNFECYKPMIAAVNGYALGGGFEIALACDIIIAADHARFALPEPTVGLNAGGGGMHRLPRQLPLKVAMGMLLTGRQISAAEAYRIGIANEVVPLADLIATAEKWAADILRCAPLSVRSTKEAGMQGLDMPLKEALDTSFPITKEMQASEDYIEGPLAFSEKRPPNWKGR